MKKLIFSIFSILLIGNAIGQKTVINDPNAEVRTAKDFHGIEVSNAIDVYLTQGDEEGIVVSAKDVEDRGRITTTVENGILIIGVEKKSWKLWGHNNQKMKAYISFKTLDKISVSGASNIYVQGTIKGSSLALNLSGASDFKGSVQLDDLAIEQSGASDVTINGNVANLTTIQTSGASDVKGYELVTQNCHAHASGASDIRITVSKELSVHATGASSIYYKGEGVIKEMHSSGASNISKKS